MRYWICLLCLSVQLLAACSTLDLEYPRTETSAFSDHQSTYLGRLYAASEKNHPGKSGLTLIKTGRDAFTIRLAMAELAERSLDLQYYIWDADQSGRILAQALLRSADRGVRVRLLVDDINVNGRDEFLASLDAHPNVEIRLFNPFVNRSSKLLGLVGDFDRLNHRMHNKLMVADNAIALLGGRNIGDHYFDVSEESNFRDLDIAAIGPVVRDSSSVFDYFWNKDWSLPVGAIVSAPHDKADLDLARKKLEEAIEKEGYPYPFRQKVAAKQRSAWELTRQLVWAPAYVVWDDPADFIAGKSGGKIIKALTDKIAGLKHELLMENAYLVPTQAGANNLEALSARGVKVRILTNSLSSNDVVAVHAGYSKYRKQLLKAGIELHEVRADSAKAQQTLFSTDSKAALHTKATIFDNASIFVGSFNLDPRSANLNTEIGLYAESPELARRLKEFMTEGVSLKNSYQLKLDQTGRIVWNTEENGEIVTYTSDPEASFGQRFMSGVIRALPIEGQL